MEGPGLSSEDLKGLRVPLRILLRIDIDQVWMGVCGRSRDVQLEARLARIRTDSHNEVRHLAARTHAFDKPPKGPTFRRS